MRYTIAFLALVIAGCKTVEVTVDYPLAAVHVAAKFEARDKPENPPASMALRADVLRK